MRRRDPIVTGLRQQPAPFPHTEAHTLGYRFLFRQALFRQALFRQALFRHAVFRQFLFRHALSMMEAYAQC